MKADLAFYLKGRTWKKETLHPAPYNLHPSHSTLHPTPYTLHPTPNTRQPTPYTLHARPYTLHPYLEAGEDGEVGGEAPPRSDDESLLALLSWRGLRFRV